ncbi:MAG: PQQ-binding-like beta-propeller repeat protein [Gemmatimonadota bacterium]
MKRASCLLLLGLVAATTGCARRNRDVGVTPGPFDWSTLQGDVRRAGTEERSVPLDPEIAWKVDVGRGLRAEPLVHEGIVVVTGTNRLIAAYSAESGERFWEQRLNASVSGGLLWRNDTLWVATESLGGEISARRLGKGGKYWEEDVGPARFPPLLVGNTIYVGTDGGALIALSALTGARQWRTRLPGGAAATPVPFGDDVVAIGGHDTLYVVAGADGRVLDRIALPAGAAAAPALAGDDLIVPLHNGSLVAVDLRLRELAWEASTGGEILATPIVAADGSVYALTTGGVVLRVPPNEERAEVLADLGGTARGSLTLVRDGLLVGLLDGTLALVQRDGATAWRRDLAGSIVAPVAVWDGAIFVPLLDGKLAKLE